MNPRMHPSDAYLRLAEGPDDARAASPRASNDSI